MSFVAIRIYTCYTVNKGVRGESKRINKKLKKSGCYLVDNGAEHDKWYSPKTDNYFRIPRHPSKEIATGTVNKILKEAGLK